MFRKYLWAFFALTFVVLGSYFDYSHLTAHGLLFGFSGGSTAAASLDVYPGCVTAPSAPGTYVNSKSWYFDIVNGHPPSYYDNPVGAITAGTGGSTGTYNSISLTGGTGTGAVANIVVNGGGVVVVNPTTDWNGLGYTNGDVLTASSASIGGTSGFSFIYKTPVPQAQWGDTNHPFDNPSAIWGQMTGGSNVQADWFGWGKTTYPYPNDNLHILALYGQYQTTPGQLQFNDGWNTTTEVIDYGNPRTYDPNHYRLWPGDTVYIRGNNSGVKYPPLTTTSASTTGTLGITGNYDGSGNIKWTWILADPNFPRPVFTSLNGGTVISESSTQGLILQNLGALAAYDYTNLDPNGFENYVAGSGGPSTINNNSVLNVPVTGGSGSGATFDLTFNTTGNVIGLGVRNGGTGYQPGDVLSVAQNTGVPTANAPLGVGGLTGFSVTILSPSTIAARNTLNMNTGEVPSNSSLVSNTTFAGTTISLNTDLVGTQKIFTFGGGANPIPFPGSASFLLDAILNSYYTLSNDPAINSLYTVNIGGVSNYNITWKTLTPITAPPANGNTFTFGYDGSTWTWVTSGATGNQINIPATNTVANAVAAANTALSAAYPPLTFTSVTTGSTGVSWTSGSQTILNTALNIGSGNTFTFAGDGSTWTWSPGASSFSGKIIGNTLYVTNLTSGSIAVGQTLVGANIGGGVHIVSGSGSIWALDKSFVNYIATETMSTVVAGKNIQWSSTTSTALANARDAINAYYLARGGNYYNVAVAASNTGLTWNQNVAYAPAIPAVAAPDLPANLSTITYAGVSTNDVWTFVTGTPSGHQIQIGASLMDTINNIQAAFASAYPGTTVTNPTMNIGYLQFIANQAGLNGILRMGSTYPYSGAGVLGGTPVPLLVLNNGVIGIKVSGGNYGLTAVKNLGSSASAIGLTLSVSPAVNAVGSLDFTSGNAFTFDSITYHWWDGTGSPPTNPVTLGGTVNSSLANAATVINSTDANLHNTTFGGPVGETKNVIIDGLNAGSWGVGHPFNPYITDYPNVGTVEAPLTLGINITNGAHGTWPHNYWNIMDWLTTPYFGGILISGNRDPSDASLQPLGGTYCVALTNTYMHHLPTVTVEETYKVLVENVNINYNSDGDSYDDYNNHDITFNKITAWNPVNPLHGIHPDGIQFGFGGPSFSVITIGGNSPYNFLFSNVKILNSKFLGGTDTVLNDPVNYPDLLTLGWDNNTYPLIDEQTCFNDTAQRVTNALVQNNFCATDNILMYFPLFQNSTFANNTAWNHGGIPAGGNGGLTIGVLLPSAGVSNGSNVIVNNLVVGLGYEPTSTSCSDTSNTILNNYIIPAYTNGSQYGGAASSAGGYMCARVVPPDRSGGTLPKSYLATDQGYASVTITNGCSGLPCDGDIITVNSINYTWRNSPTLATDIKIGTTVTQSLLNAQTTIQAHDLTIAANPNLVSLTKISWGPKNQFYENGGIKYWGRSDDTGTMFQAFAPPNNEIADPTTINGEPPGYPVSPTGPLVCSGTNIGGYAAATNIDGNAWGGGAGCVGIGAY